MGTRSKIAISVAASMLLSSTLYGAAAIANYTTDTTGVQSINSDIAITIADGVTVSHTGAVFYYVGGTTPTVGNGITNNGTLKGGDASRVIYTHKNSPIVNNGKIEATGVANAATVAILSAEAPDITNNSGATISATHTLNHAIAIEIGAASTNTITNAGTIIATTTSSSHKGYSLKATSGNGFNSTINNTGTITGAIDLGTSTATFNNNAGGTITSSYLSAAQSDFVNYGTLNITKEGAANKLKTLDQKASGTLKLIATSSSGGSLAVSGNVTIADSSTVDVVTTKFTVDELKTLLDNSGKIYLAKFNGTTTANWANIKVTDDQSDYSFTLQLDGSDLVALVGEQKAAAILASLARTGGSLDSVAIVLDNYAGGNADIDAFKTYLSNYTGDALAKKVEQSTPSVAAAAPQVNTQVTTAISNVVSTRQSGMRGKNSGDMQFSDKNFWLKPFGSLSKQKDKKGISGFDATSKGIAVGIDGEYADGKRAGISFFYTATEVDTNNVNQTNDIGSYTLIGYGSQPIIDDTTTLYYQAGVSLQDNKSKRVIDAVSKSAEADYKSYSTFITSKVTKDFAINDSLTIVPELGGTLSVFKNDSYTESGAGGMNLSTESFKSHSVVASLANSVKYAINKKTDVMARAGVSYDFINKTSEVTSTYTGGGSKFSTKGLKASPFSYEAGVGLSRDIKEDLSIDINYDFSGKSSGYTNHAVAAKFVWNF
jgi:outer membrane autotransporter protein